MNSVIVSKIIYWSLWISGIFVAAHYQALDVVTSFFFVIAAGSLFCFLGRQEKPKKSGHKTTEHKIALWLCSAVLCLALFARSIFMKNARIEIYPQKILAVILLTAVLHPLSLIILTIMESVNDKFGKDEEKRKASSKQIVFSGFLCAMFVFTIDIIFSLGYFPCNMTNDSYGHWLQATGQAAMSDYSPISYNLLVKGLITLFRAKTPYVYCVFQIALFSVVVGDIAAFLRRRGVTLLVLVVGSVIIACTPSTYMLLTYLSKNPLTAVLCLWVTFSLAEVISDAGRYLQSPIWFIKTIFAISGLYLVRENNMVIAIPIIAFSIWFMIRHKELRNRILIMTGGAALVICLIQGLVYRQIEYEHANKSHETVRPLLAPVGSAIQQGLSLPDDILSVAEKVLPAEEWKSRYDPFNSDLLTWGNPRPQYINVSLGEAFRVYLKMLRIYPDVVIRDRLDGMNLIWDARAQMYRYAIGLVRDVSFKEIKLSNNTLITGIVGEIRKLSTSLLVNSIENKLVDTFIWKNGVYLYFLFVIIIFLKKNRNWNLLWAILPSVFILLTNVFVIAWQMYFYIWFFPLSVVLLMIISLTYHNGHNEMMQTV